jgi:hypothetical protein
MQTGAWRRRLPVVLLLLAMVLGFLPVPAAAQDPANETPTVTIPETTLVTVTPTETTTDLKSPPGVGLLAAPPPSIDVSVDPAIVIFGGAGGMLVPATYTTNVTVTVQAQGVANWYLRAEDTTPGTGAKGFLYRYTPPGNLTAPFRIWDFTIPGFRPIGTGSDIFYSSTKPGKSTVETPFMQETGRTDLSGSYTLLVAFTATTS